MPARDSSLLKNVEGLAAPELVILCTPVADVLESIEYEGLGLSCVSCWDIAIPATTVIPKTKTPANNFLI